MPKLYIDLTHADDANVLTGQRRLLYVGTAAEVIAMAERVNQYLEEHGFSDDMDQKHQSPEAEHLKREIMGGMRL